MDPALKELVERLEARRAVVSHDPGRFLMTSEPDGDCRSAAEAIRQLCAENEGHEARMSTILAGECACCVLTRAQCADTIAQIQIDARALSSHTNKGESDADPA